MNPIDPNPYLADAGIVRPTRDGDLVGSRRAGAGATEPKQRVRHTTQPRISAPLRLCGAIPRIMRPHCPRCAHEAPPASPLCPECGHGLDAAPSAPARSEPDAAPFLPGAILARRHRLVGLMGRGGIGEVDGQHSISMEFMTARPWRRCCGASAGCRRSAAWRSPGRTAPRGRRRPEGPYREDPMPRGLRALRLALEPAQHELQRGQHRAVLLSVGCLLRPDHVLETGHGHVTPFDPDRDRPPHEILVAVRA